MVLENEIIPPFTGREIVGQVVELGTDRVFHQNPESFLSTEGSEASEGDRLAGPRSQADLRQLYSIYARPEGADPADMEATGVQLNSANNPVLT